MNQTQLWPDFTNDPLVINIIYYYIVSFILVLATLID